ncbi:MAG TPA: hypothetical protein VD813_02260 [Pseudonocardia sp.]|nr:hypothetical protein [Pseudonocardia sp.]
MASIVLCGGGAILVRAHLCDPAAFAHAFRRGGRAGRRGRSTATGSPPTGPAGCAYSPLPGSDRMLICQRRTP